MSIDLLVIILTTAVVSNLVFVIFLIVNDYQRRKSEEKRVMLKIAMKLTELRNDQTLKINIMNSKKRFFGQLHTAMVSQLLQI